MTEEEKKAAQLNHDIKSTVTSVKAYTQLLLRKTKSTLDKKTFAYLTRLDKQVDLLIKQIIKLKS